MKKRVPVYGGMVPRRGASARVQGEEAVLSHEVEREAAFSELLQEMRLRAGLTIGEVADRMGSKPGSLYQYLYKKRGSGGTSTMRWFLRYAEACGCEVALRFPDMDRPAVVRYRKAAT
jgi:hypothetical protein